MAGALVHPQAPPTRTEIVAYISVTLAISWALGWIWIQDPTRWVVVQWLMCVPGLVGLFLAWIFRRERPRAVGFELTGIAPWVAALVYPLVVAALAVALAYLVRGVSGNASFISFEPQAYRYRDVTGFAAVGARLLKWSPVIALAFATALLYRFKIPDRVREVLPARLKPLHHAVRAAPFAAIIWTYPGHLPGSYAEEFGWRGYLVRRLQSRPARAALITMPVWAAYHLPLLFVPADARATALQNAVFLGSVAAAAVPFAALYLWSRSVWPCAVLHLWWNLWNPSLLGDVYSGRPGIFRGEMWAFNGEGLFGLLIHGAVAAVLFWRWRRASEPSAIAAAPAAG